MGDPITFPHHNDQVEWIILYILSDLSCIDVEEF